MSDVNRYFSLLFKPIHFPVSSVSLASSTSNLIHQSAFKSIFIFIIFLKLNKPANCLLLISLCWKFTFHFFVFFMFFVKEISLYVSVSYIRWYIETRLLNNLLFYKNAFTLCSMLAVPYLKPLKIIFVLKHSISSFFFCKVILNVKTHSRVKRFSLRFIWKMQYLYIYIYMDLYFLFPISFKWQTNS